MFAKFLSWLRDPYAGARAQADREMDAIEAWIKAGAPGDRPWTSTNT